MSQFTIYRSTDASAPTVSGTAGDLTALLDACLVNGYGTKANAGWSIAYTATNRRAYRGGSGTQLYFRVQDDAGGTGGAKEALIRGFETMSDVNTGTNAFPATSLTANSYTIRKSSTADSNTHPWIVAADNKTCYVFIQTADLTNVYHAVSFGDFYSLVAGDVWNAYISGRGSENTGQGVSTDLDNFQGSIVPNNPAVTMSVARNYNGAVGLQTYHRVTTWGMSVNGISASLLPFPNPADNGIYLSRVFFGQQNSTPPGHVRGYFRGYWGWLHNGGVNDGDTFSGSGDLTGKTFLIIKNSPNAVSNNQGLFVIETSNTLP
jgi:hypothetical protein